MRNTRSEPRTLGDRIIRDLPVQQGKKGTRIYDATLNNFFLRHSESGQWAFYIAYRDTHGRKREPRIAVWSDAPLRSNTEMNCTEARAAAAAMLAQIKANDLEPLGIKKTKRQIPTLEEFLMRPDPQLEMSIWDIRVAKNIDRPDGEKKRFERCFHQWYKLHLDEINKSLIESYCFDKMHNRDPKKRVSLATIKNDFNLMSVILNYAVKAGYIERNPYIDRDKRNDKKPDRKKEVRTATADEITAIRAALRKRDEDARAARERLVDHRQHRNRDDIPAPYGKSFIDFLEPFTLISINTGMRPIEILRLKWKNVDLDGRWLHLKGMDVDNRRGTKTGQSRNIPLSNEALKCLTLWKQQSKKTKPDNLVFPSTAKGREGEQMISVPHSYRRMLDENGLNGLGHYAFRHAFATTALEHFPDVQALSDVFGSDAKTILSTYVHSRSKDRLRNSIDSMFNG